MPVSQHLLEQIPKATLLAIDDGIDNLEEILEPLMAQPLEETLQKLSIVQRAKLQTVLPYIIYSLIISEYRILRIER